MKVRTYGFEVSIATLTKARAKMEDLAPIAQEAANVIAASIRENIEESRTPLGGPFTPLKPKTIKEKERLGFDLRPLIRTGALIDSIAAYMNSTSARRATAIVGYVPKYGAYHNSGTARIPRRPFMGVNAETSDLLSEELRGFALSIFGEGAGFSGGGGVQYGRTKAFRAQAQ